MEEKLHLHEFFVEGGDQSLSHVLLHISEPFTPEEKTRGYFFALAEINNGSTEQIMKLQEIIDKIENEYYSAPEPVNVDLLEYTLEKINSESYALIQPGIDLHCVAGAIRQGEISLSSYGQPQVILFYQKRDGTYHKMDLISSPNPAETIVQKQLFSQVVQGKITPRDFLFIGTPHIIKHFSHDRLQKIITTRPTRQTAEHLQRVLGEQNDSDSFGGLIVNLTTITDSTPVKKIRPANNLTTAKNSLSNLFGTERRTESTLSPSLIPKMNNLSDFFNKETNPSETPTIRKEVKKFPEAEINSSHLRQFHPRSNRVDSKNKKTIWETITAIGKVLQTILIWLGKGLYWLGILIWAILAGMAKLLMVIFFLITNYQNRRRNTWENITRQWLAYKNNFKQLPTVTKILFAISIIIVLSLVIGIWIIKLNQARNLEQKNYANAVQQIKTKKDAAESALVYQNENAAAIALQEAIDIYTGLKCDVKKDSECLELKEQLDQLTAKISKLSPAESVVLAQWKKLPIELAKINNQIIGFNDSTSTLFVYDILTKENKTLIAPSSQFTAASTPKENDYILFLEGEKNLYQYKPDGTFKKLDISYPKDNAAIKSIVVYNRRLYALDSINNQIYKHDSIKTGFGPGKEWIKDSNTDVKDGVDLTIDGDLFVLKNNGTIEKMTNGKKENFNLQGLQPTLKNGGEVWTYTDIKNIYILDTLEKRLIVTDKNGKLITQITDAQWEAPTGLITDEVNKRAYVVDQGQLLQIKLP